MTLLFRSVLSTLRDAGWGGLSLGLDVALGMCERVRLRLLGESVEEIWEADDVFLKRLLRGVCGAHDMRCRGSFLHVFGKCFHTRL